MIILRALFRIAVINGLAVIAGFAIFLALVRSPLLSGLDIIFYRGVALAILTMLPLGLIGLFAGRFVQMLDLSTGVGALAVSLSFNLCFLVVFPVTIDRSVTVFLLSRIEQSEKPLNESMLRDRFAGQYLCDMAQIQRRIEEQALSGNVRIDSGKVVLSAQGKQFMTFSRIIAQWFDTDRRMLEAPDTARARDVHIVCR